MLLPDQLIRMLSISKQMLLQLWQNEVTLNTYYTVSSYNAVVHILQMMNTMEMIEKLAV